MLRRRVTDLADHHVDDIETRYEFLEELGKGASSQVYLARRRESTPSSPGGANLPVIDLREVAIKVFDTEELDDDDVFEASVDAVFAESPSARVDEHAVVGRVSTRSSREVQLRSSSSCSSLLLEAAPPPPPRWARRARRSRGSHRSSTAPSRP